MARGDVVSVCPEMLGGLPVPRHPAEIQKGATAQDIITGTGRVKNHIEQDVTEYFIRGAQKVLEIAKQQHIKVAILKEKSPSCGSSKMYDGTFSGKVISGFGVTTALLRENGIQVFSEIEIDKALDAAMLTENLINR